MTAPTPRPREARVELSEEERRDLRVAAGTFLLSHNLRAGVERILAARLAPIEALAEEKAEWAERLAKDPRPGYREIGQVHASTAEQIRAALRDDPCCAVPVEPAPDREAPGDDLARLTKAEQQQVRAWAMSAIGCDGYGGHHWIADDLTYGVESLLADRLARTEAEHQAEVERVKAERWSAAEIERALREAGATEDSMATDEDVINYGSRAEAVEIIRDMLGLGR